MKQYILNAENMTTRESAHDEIARSLEMPAHYGRNLDALWDELSCLRGEIILTNVSALTGYVENVLQILQEAAQKNPHLALTIQTQ